MTLIFVTIALIFSYANDVPDNGCSSYTSEEINMFYCSTSMKRKIYFYNNNKIKSLNLEFLVRIIVLINLNFIVQVT